MERKIYIKPRNKTELEMKFNKNSLKQQKIFGLKCKFHFQILPYN